MKLQAKYTADEVKELILADIERKGFKSSLEAIKEVLENVGGYDPEYEFRGFEVEVTVAK